MSYDFLVSADYVVADADTTFARFAAVLGLPDQDPRWRLAHPGDPYMAWFARLQPSLAAAPTRLEVLCRQAGSSGSSPSDPAMGPALESLLAQQGPDRPMRTHATVLACDDVHRFVSKLARRRVPYRLAPLTEHMPFDRVWIGVRPERPTYDPGFDAGLAIEIVSSEAFRSAYRQPTTTGSPDGPVRIEARAMLVPDLDDALRTLSLHLDLEPDAPTEYIGDEGYRRARMTFALANSAALEIIQPVRWDSAPGRYLATWGPGPYHTRITVSDLDAARGRLEGEGVAFTEPKATSAVNGRARVRIDPIALDGAPVELVGTS